MLPEAFGVLVLYSALSLPALLVVCLFGIYLRARGPWTKVLLFVPVSTLLLTPTLASATIAAVPVAFGLPLVLSLLTGEVFGTIQAVAEFPIWHAIAFPATAVVSYVVARLAL